jgi:hypothetical protein
MAIGPDGTAAIAWTERDLRNPATGWVAVRRPGADFGAALARSATLSAAATRPRGACSPPRPVTPAAPRATCVSAC